MARSYQPTALASVPLFLRQKCKAIASLGVTCGQHVEFPVIIGFIHKIIATNQHLTNFIVMLSWYQFVIECAQCCQED